MKEPGDEVGKEVHRAESSQSDIRGIGDTSFASHGPPMAPKRSFTSVFNHESSAFWGAMGGIIGGLLGASVAFATFLLTYLQSEAQFQKSASQSARIAREAAYIASIQSRIEGCNALSAHHRAAAEREEEYKEIAVLTLDDGSEKLLSGNHERFTKSVGMGRGLLLCMATREGDELRDCISRISSDRSKYFVFDYIGADPTIYGRERRNGEVFPGQSVLIC